MKSKVSVRIFFFTFLSDSLYWFCLYEIFTFPESVFLMKKKKTQDLLLIKRKL